MKWSYQRRISPRIKLEETEMDKYFEAEEARLEPSRNEMIDDILNDEEQADLVIV